jgi:hypothetical protein
VTATDGDAPYGGGEAASRRGGFPSARWWREACCRERTEELGHVVVARRLSASHQVGATLSHVPERLTDLGRVTGSWPRVVYDHAKWAGNGHGGLKVGAGDVEHGNIIDCRMDGEKVSDPGAVGIGEDGHILPGRQERGF